MAAPVSPCDEPVLGSQVCSLPHDESQQYQYAVRRACVLGIAPKDSPPNTACVHASVTQAWPLLCDFACSALAFPNNGT